jgi:hypothetical protein
MENMIENGYKVTINSGWYWVETSYIFRDYINELFAVKAKAEKNTAPYTLAKLFMNALYGKMIQRPIYQKTGIISNNSEYWKFWGGHEEIEITELGKYHYISGTPRDVVKREKCISKPTHLGVFILAYSRRIMLNYIKQANPYYSIPGTEQMANDIFYTDTDSLQMKAKNALSIPRIDDDTLGGFTNDLGRDSKVIRGIWIAPKLYMLEYLKRGSNEVHIHMKGKGLPSESLTVEAFENMYKGESFTSVKNFQMKRVGVKLTSFEKADGINQFCILFNENISKTVNINKWAGRTFTGNDSVPLM